MSNYAKLELITHVVAVVLALLSPAFLTWITDWTFIESCIVLTFLSLSTFVARVNNHSSFR